MFATWKHGFEEYFVLCFYKGNTVGVALEVQHINALAGVIGAWVFDNVENAIAIDSYNAILKR